MRPLDTVINIYGLQTSIVATLLVVDWENDATKLTAMLKSNIIVLVRVRPSFQFRYNNISIILYIINIL